VEHLLIENGKRPEHGKFKSLNPNPTLNVSQVAGRFESGCTATLSERFTREIMSRNRKSNE
jgi:hypothetical protein